MRISRIAVKNCKGFSDFACDCGDIVVLSGRNGQGKSSVLDIVCAAFSSDSARELLKAGCEEGEILVILEDQGETLEVRRKLRPGSVEQPTIKSSRSGRIGAPRAFLKQLVDAVAMDPLRRVMTASPKEQATILLETMPLDLDHGEITAAVKGVDVEGLAAILRNASSLPALDAIKAVEDRIYTERTGINRDAKTKRAHAQQLRAQAGPAGDDDDWAERAKSLQRELERIAGDESNQKLAAEKDHANCKEEIGDDAISTLTEIHKDIDAKISALERERDGRKATISENRANRIESAERNHRSLLEEIEHRVRPERERISAEHAIAQQNASHQGRLAEAIRIAGVNDGEAAGLESRSDAMTAALKALGAVRANLLEKLPIKGLKIEGGRAYLAGIPLEEVNTSERAKFWVRVSVMRAMAKDLGIILIDDAEHFDDQNFPLLLDACKRTEGIQFFISMVAPHPLKIECLSSESQGYAVAH